MPAHPCPSSDAASCEAASSFGGGVSGPVRRTSLEPGRAPATLLGITQRSLFRYIKTSPEVIRLAVMLSV